MPYRPLTLACWFLLSLFLPGWASAFEVRFEPVAEGVYAYIGESGPRTFQNYGLNANYGLVVTPAGALLIDSGASRQGAEMLAKAAQRVTAQPIRWVINSGSQDQRWLGNSYFRSQGAEIMAHAGAETDMRNRGQAHLNQLRPVLKQRLQGTELVLPQRWLQGTDETLSLGGVAVEVKYRGGGHSPGDVIVWLPQQRVAFAGDVVYVQRMLGMNPASRTKPWLASFAALESLQPAVVVPGHGPLTTLEQAQRDTRDLLVALRQHMRAAVSEMTDMDSAVKSFDGSAFMRLEHAETWLPQLANRTYLDVERE